MIFSCGIDLSLRSTGICLYNENEVHFELIKNPEDKDEFLIINNTKNILNYLQNFQISNINIEGLSYNSLSNSKDIINGNFWYLRCALKEKNYSIKIVPVTSWRSPLFNKEERIKLKNATNEVKELKKRKLKKTELIEYEEIIKGSCIKYQTFLKCPVNIQKQILNICSKDGKFDLSDSYFLAKFNR